MPRDFIPLAELEEEKRKRLRAAGELVAPVHEAIPADMKVKAADEAGVDFVPATPQDMVDLQEINSAFYTDAKDDYKFGMFAPLPTEQQSYVHRPAEDTPMYKPEDPTATIVRPEKTRYKGVNYEDGLADISMRTALPFFKDGDKIKYMNKHNMKAVRMPNKDLIYLNPETNQWTAIEEEDITHYDVAEWVKWLPEIGGGVAGVVLAAPIPVPGARVAGAGWGTALGRGIQEGIAEQILGEETEVIKKGELLEEMLWAGGAGAIGEAGGILLTEPLSAAARLAKTDLTIAARRAGLSIQAFKKTPKGRAIQAAKDKIAAYDWWASKGGKLFPSQVTDGSITQWIDGAARQSVVGAGRMARKTTKQLQMGQEVAEDVMQDIATRPSRVVSTATPDKPPFSGLVDEQIETATQRGREVGRKEFEDWLNMMGEAGEALPEGSARRRIMQQDFERRAIRTEIENAERTARQAYEAAGPEVPRQRPSLLDAEEGVETLHRDALQVIDDAAEQMADRLTQDMADGVLNREAAGVLIQDMVLNEKVMTKKVFDVLYEQELSKLPRDVVDITTLKRKLVAMLDDLAPRTVDANGRTTVRKGNNMLFERYGAAESDKELIKWIESIIELPDEGTTFNILRNQQTMFNEIGRKNMYMPDKTVGTAKKISKELDNTIHTELRKHGESGIKTSERLRELNKNYREYTALYGSKFLRRVLDKDPEFIIDQVFKPRGVTGLKEFKRALAGYIPDKQMSGEMIAYAEESYQKAVTAFIKDLVFRQSVNSQGDVMGSMLNRRLLHYAGDLAENNHFLIEALDKDISGNVVEGKQLYKELKMLADSLQMIQSKPEFNKAGKRFVQLVQGGAILNVPLAYFSPGTLGVGFGTSAVLIFGPNAMERMISNPLSLRMLRKGLITDIPGVMNEQWTREATRQFARWRMIVGDENMRRVDGPEMYMAPPTTPTPGMTGQPQQKRPEDILNQMR